MPWDVSCDDRLCVLRPKSDRTSELGCSLSAFTSVNFWARIRIDFIPVKPSQLRQREAE